VGKRASPAEKTGNIRGESEEGHGGEKVAEKNSKFVGAGRKKRYFQRDTLRQDYKEKGIHRQKKYENKYGSFLRKRGR